MIKITGKLQTLLGPPIEWQGPSDHIELPGPQTVHFKHCCCFADDDEVGDDSPRIFFTKQCW